MTNGFVFVHAAEAMATLERWGISHPLQERSARTVKRLLKLRKWRGESCYLLNDYVAKQACYAFSIALGFLGIRGRMKSEEKQLKEIVKLLTACGGGRFGKPTANFLKWASDKKLNTDCVIFFKKYMPHADVWAGSATLFPESELIEYNDFHPEALENGLLLIGTCANGDFVALDCHEKSVGYLPHELIDDSFAWREHFEVVSESIGRFLSESNESEVLLPEDYYEAVEWRQAGR